VIFVYLWLDTGCKFCYRMETMNKIILTLLGVVGLAGVSWGQMAISNLPSSVTLQNLPVFSDSQYGQEPNYNGDWVESGTWDYGPGYRGKSYTNSSLPYGTSVNVTISGQDTFVNFYYIAHVDNGVQGYIQYRSTNGLNFSDLQLVGASVTGAPATLGTNYFANGFTPEGYLVGGAPSSGGGGGDDGGGSGGAFVNQAKELNVGLQFNNGEWTPVP
jgi:hypothetical protein